MTSWPEVIQEIRIIMGIEAPTIKFYIVVKSKDGLTVYGSQRREKILTGKQIKIISEREQKGTLKQLKLSIANHMKVKSSMERDQEGNEYSWSGQMQYRWQFRREKGK